MGDSVWVLGANMIKFGRYPDKDTMDLASTAALAAMSDGGVTIHDMGVLAVGCLNEAAAAPGQRLQKQIGQTGIPVYNVANACATGATAVRCVYMSIKSGECDMGLAVGVEQMGKQGLLGGAARGRSDRKVFEPSGRYGAVMGSEGVLGSGLMPSVFSNAGMEYANRNDGVGFEQFAKVAEKNHQHSTLNPLAQYQKAFSLDEVMNAEVIAYPNTLLMCCPTGDGSAAVVLVSEEKLKTLSAEQRKRAVKISASVMTSDEWTESDQVQPDVNTLTRRAADKAYALAGVDPKDLDLVELHDCFATAELLHYENLGLCDEGEAGRMIDEGEATHGGRVVVAPSGGLLSKGHPLGATGVANICEVVWHLRGQAGDRQVEGAKAGLAHVIGLGSACAVHILEKAAG
jgi:acetyl-CoA acetyltransferase